MLHLDHARSSRILRKRVRRLLEIEGAPADSELKDKILPFLGSLGSVALIGGAIRDVARAGKKAFSSDFDFVIYGSDRERFIAEMKVHGGIGNRFGGYALNRFKMKIDVWHIEDTWARTAGLASVATPSDLLNCTFFDWDSIVYEISSGHLLAPLDYFERLFVNVMDIRLEKNPNPIGSLVRALRRAALWHVRFGPRLTAFCKTWLEQTDWNELVALDTRAFLKPVLRFLDRDVVNHRLYAPSKTSIGEVTLPVPEAQLKLPLAPELNDSMLAPEQGFAGVNAADNHLRGYAQVGHDAVVVWAPDFDTLVADVESQLTQGCTLRSQTPFQQNGKRWFSWLNVPQGACQLCHGRCKLR